MSNDVREQCKQALLNRELKLHLCDICRRKNCPDRIKLKEDGRRVIYCERYKVKTLRKEV